MKGEFAKIAVTIGCSASDTRNFFTMSALIAAERCLIPFDCDDFSRRALYGLLEAVEEIRAERAGRELAAAQAQQQQMQGEGMKALGEGAAALEQVSSTVPRPGAGVEPTEMGPPV